MSAERWRRNGAPRAVRQGGVLGCFARAAARGVREGWRGALPALLAELAQELEAGTVAWLPGEGPGAAWSGPRPDPRAVDWELVARLDPGEVRRPGAADRRRSPRLAAGEGPIVLARPGADVPGGGVLCLLGTPSAARERLGSPELAALAEMVAAVAGLERAEGSAQARRRELAIGRSVATVTHDLRNQLTLALLQLERLRVSAGDETRDAALDGLDALESVLCAARDLCAETLTGAPPAPRKRLVLRAVLVEEARAAASVARTDREVRVRVRCPTALRVHGDLSALARVVRNLLVNAVEASVAGGEVRAGARAAGDGRVELAVEDDGAGMAADEVARLFAPGASARGSGYGTASLLEGLEVLDAECEVSTAPGAGTRVTVLLPGIPDEERPAVLVLDRDARRRRRRARSLVAAGLGPLEASDPRRALALLRGTRARAVLMARGTSGAGREELAEHCRREGIERVVVGVLDGEPAPERWMRAGTGASP